MSANSGMSFSGSVNERVGRLALRGFICAATAAAFVAVTAGSASADPGLTDDDTTDAHIAVGSSITLSGLTAEFTLSGMPGSTVSNDQVVAFNVKTANLAGYTVTVQSQTSTMTSDNVTNLDAIPIAALRVRETGTSPFTALSTGTALVHTQATRSIEAGDSLSNDYQVAIPFVNEDTYTATLNYVATTL